MITYQKIRIIKIYITNSLIKQDISKSTSINCETIQKSCYLLQTKCKNILPGINLSTGLCKEDNDIYSDITMKDMVQYSKQRPSKNTTLSIAKANTLIDLTLIKTMVKNCTYTI